MGGAWKTAPLITSPKYFYHRKENAMQNVIDLNNDEYAVIDMDSGTVLGTNVVLVRIADADPEEWEDILSNDSAAWEFGSAVGQTLHVTV